MGASLSELVQECYVTDEWMSDVTSSKFECSVQVDTMDPSLSNSTPMDPLNTTDSSPCTLHLSSLACLTSVCSDRLLFAPALQSSSSPFLSLQTHAISLSRSVDSSALSYTVRSPSSTVVKCFSTCTNLKCMCTFVSVRST